MIKVSRHSQHRKNNVVLRSYYFGCNIKGMSLAVNVSKGKCATDSELHCTSFCLSFSLQSLQLTCAHSKLVWFITKNHLPMHTAVPSSILPPPPHVSSRLPMHSTSSCYTVTPFCPPTASKGTQSQCILPPHAATKPTVSRYILQASTASWWADKTKEKANR